MEEETLSEEELMHEIKEWKENYAEMQAEMYEQNFWFTFYIKWYNIITGTRLKLATLIERMVLEHFVPVFIQD